MSRSHKKNTQEMKLIIGLFVFTACISAALFFIFKSTPVQEFLHGGTLAHDTVINTPKGAIFVEIADTDSARELGLSFKKKISTDEGMLFVFDTPGNYAFWMKDMNFPLDIIWLDENGRVVKIEGNVAPSTYPGYFVNDAKAKYVLEISASTSEKLGIYLGTKLKLK